MFLLNVEFGRNVSVSGFPASHFDCLSFSIPAFSVATVLTRASRVLEVACIFTKHSKCCDIFYVLTISLYSFISLLYKQLLQYTLLKSFTVPSAAILTKFPKKFYAKLLAPAFIFTKFSTKTLCFDAAVFHSSIKGYCKTRPHRSYCFLSMFKLHCKRLYRNLVGVQHDVNTSKKRRRRSAAAAHSSIRDMAFGLHLRLWVTCVEQWVAKLGYFSHVVGGFLWKTSGNHTSAIAWYTPIFRGPAAFLPMSDGME